MGYKKWQEKHAGPLPPVDWMVLDPANCPNEVAAGYPSILPGVEYNKDKNQHFADAHRILQRYYVPDLDALVHTGAQDPVQQVCEFIHDFDCSMFPAVRKAWKEAGNEDNSVTIGKCK